MYVTLHAITNDGLMPTLLKTVDMLLSEFLPNERFSSSMLTPSKQTV